MSVSKDVEVIKEIADGIVVILHIADCARKLLQAMILFIRLCFVIGLHREFTSCPALIRSSVSRACDSKLRFRTRQERLKFERIESIDPGLLFQQNLEFQTLHGNSPIHSARVRFEPAQSPAFFKYGSRLCWTKDNIARSVRQS